MLKKNLIILLLLPVVILGGKYSVVTESSPWGIVANWDNYYSQFYSDYKDKCDSAYACGLSWIRPNCIPYPDILQDSDGLFDFAEIDSFVKFMQDRNLNSLSFGWPNDSEDLNGFYWYYRILVERYDGDGEGIYDSIWNNGYVSEPEWLKKPIKYWEICNEPYAGHIGNRGWPNYGNRTVEDFRAYIRAASKGIHDADSEAKVIAPCLEPLKCYWRSKQIMENDWRPISVTVKPGELPDATQDITVQFKAITTPHHGQMGSVWIDNVWCQSNNMENYGFETGDLSNWEQWSPDGLLSWTVSTDSAREGTYSLYSPYFSSDSSKECIFQKFSLSEIDKPFSASCWVKTETLTGGLKIYVTFWNADWTEGYGNISSDIITGTNPWTKIYVIVNEDDIPAEAVNFKVVLRRLKGDGQLWVDDVWCQSNVIENYSFEDGLDGWSLWETEKTLWYISNEAQEGNFSLTHDEFFDDAVHEFCIQRFSKSELSNPEKPFKVSCYVKDSSLYRGIMLIVGAEDIGTNSLGAKTSSEINSYYLSPDSLWWEIFRDGIDTCVDIISVHEYWYGNECMNYFELDNLETSLEEIDSMKTILDNLGLGNKPIWFTEGGRARDEDSDPTDEKRAETFKEWCKAVLKRDWFNKMIFYSLRCDPIAILDRDLAHYPPYDTLKDFIDRNTPNIDLVSPSEGNTMYGGHYFEIVYNSIYDQENINPSSDISIRLEYSIDGGWNYNEIESNLSPTGSYNWIPPSVTSDSCKLRVIARDSDSLEGMSTNYGFITIKSGLQNKTVEIGETRNYWSPDSIITAGDSTFFVIEGNGSTGGNVTMRAGNYISLLPFFESKDGCFFEAYIDPSLKPTPSSFSMKKISLTGTFKSNEPKKNSNNTSDKKVSKETKPAIPTVFSCNQNFPNPFASSTIIKYGLPKDSKVNLCIYNLLGQKVRTLVDGQQLAGYKSVSWDSRTSSGKKVPQGIYFYTFKAGDYTKHRKMILLK